MWQAISPPKQIILLSQAMKENNREEAFLYSKKGKKGVKFSSKRSSPVRKSSEKKIILSLQGGPLQVY